MYFAAQKTVHYLRLSGRSGSMLHLTCPTSRPSESGQFVSPVPLPSAADAQPWRRAEGQSRRGLAIRFGRRGSVRVETIKSFSRRPKPRGAAMSYSFKVKLKLIAPLCVLSLNPILFNQKHLLFLLPMHTGALIINVTGLVLTFALSLSHIRYAILWPW